MKSALKFLLYQLAIFSILGMQAKTINFQKPANDNRDFEIRFRKYINNEVFKQSDTIKPPSGSFSLPSQITLHGTTANPNLPNETVKTDDQNLTIVILYGSYILFEKLLSQLSDGTTIASPEGTKVVQDRCWSIK